MGAIWGTGNKKSNKEEGWKFNPTLAAKGQGNVVEDRVGGGVEMGRVT